MLISRLKQWITTLLGLILMAVSGYLLYSGSINITEFSAFLPTCLGLFWAKNSFVTDIFASHNKTRPLSMILFFLLVTSCRTSLPVVPSSSIESVSKIATNAVTTISQQQGYIKPDSSLITALFRCDSLGNAYMEQITELKMGTVVKPVIEVKDHYVTLKCKIDSVMIFSKYFLSHQFSSDTSIVEKRLPPIVTDELTPFRKFMIKMGWICLIMLSALVLYFVYKLKF